jgi:hypothetical protein
MKGVLGMWLVALTAAACGGSQNDAKPPKVNPNSVPALALLDEESERRQEVTASGDGDSCEDVINEQRRKASAGEVSGEEPPEDQAEEIKAVLNHGTYLDACDVPETTSVDVCAAIMNGAALGVSVTLDPGTNGEASCVANFVRRMEFPAHELVSVARTEFRPQ